MVLADLGRKITTALHSLSRATVINEDVSLNMKIIKTSNQLKIILSSFHLGTEFNVKRNMCRIAGS